MFLMLNRIDLIKNTVRHSNIVKCELLQSPVSHDLSENILICKSGAQKTFIIINIENSCLIHL